MEQNQTTNGVQRQLVLRMFLPNMETLKATAREVSAMPGVKLGLYGQAGEVLVAVTVTTATAAAATQLAESAAARFEEAMGDCVYARGRESLAHTVAEELVTDDASLAAADADTGRLLETEMKTAKQGERVFDFGQTSFRNPRISARIEKTADMGDTDELPLYQLAADRSFAAEKCTKSAYGVAITGTGEGSKMVCVAVTHKKYVYVRCIRPAADADKGAALSALDMIRRLILGLPIPYARAFLASEEIDWNNPINAKNRSKKSGKGGIAAIVVLLVLVAAALVVGGVFLYRTFFADGSGAQSTVSTSMAASTPASVPASAAVTSAPAAPADAAATTAAGEVTHPLAG